MALERATRGAAGNDLRESGVMDSVGRVGAGPPLIMAAVAPVQEHLAGEVASHVVPAPGPPVEEPRAAAAGRASADVTAPEVGRLRGLDVAGRAPRIPRPFEGVL